jgi:hypothetical protein
MLPEIIIETEKLKPYINGWYKGNINSPKSPKDNSIIFYKYDKNLIFLTGIQHYNNENIINNYLIKIDNNINNISKDKLTKTELTGIEKFNKLLFIPYDYTIIPKCYSMDIHEKEILIMPIHDFEVDGNETIDEMKEMFRYYLSPIDWTRRPIDKECI